MRATDASKGSAAGRDRRTGRVLLVVLAFAAAPAVAADGMPLPSAFACTCGSVTRKAPLLPTWPRPSRDAGSATG